MHTTERLDLLVLGVHKASPGYPNILYRLQELRESDRFHYREINIPLWREGLVGSKALTLLRAGIRAILAHTGLLMSYLKGSKPQVLYVPYPAIGALAMLSLLSRRHRPRHVVADIFISAYDTVVNDRRLLSRGNLLARLIRLIEKRACTFADVIVVDTPENAAWLCREYHLPKDKVWALPLSTDECHFRPNPYQPNNTILRVLFVGTLVPLHGIATIIEAAVRLGYRSDISFRLIGDGQDAPLIEKVMKDTPMENMEWVRDWHPPERIAEEIEHADICLGIFGETAKAQRVCPFKLYVYSRVGRPVITGHTVWLQRVVSELGYTPFATVPVNDPAALANKIAELADNPSLRQQLAVNSRRYYESALSNQIAHARFLECLIPLTA